MVLVKEIRKSYSSSQWYLPVELSKLPFVWNKRNKKSDIINFHLVQWRMKTERRSCMPMWNGPKTWVENFTISGSKEFNFRMETLYYLVQTSLERPCNNPFWAPTGPQEAFMSQLSHLPDGAERFLLKSNYKIVKDYIPKRAAHYSRFVTVVGYYNTSRNWFTEIDVTQSWYIL